MECTKLGVPCVPKCQVIVYNGIIPHPRCPLRVFSIDLLTHLSRATHICVSKLTIIASDNGLSSGRCEAIIWTSAGIMSIGPLETNFSEILIEIITSSIKKMCLKMSSAKWRPCCLDLNVLNLLRRPASDACFDSLPATKPINHHYRVYWNTGNSLGMDICHNMALPRIRILIFVLRHPPFNNWKVSIGSLINVVRFFIGTWIIWWVYKCNLYVPR